MDKIIQDIINRIYINRGDNQAMDIKYAQKMKGELENILGGIKNISFEIQISQDNEYKKIEYGKNCAVALDIVVSNNSKCKLVIQISKLGKFARIYWRKKSWVFGKIFKYELPERWTEKLVTQIKDAISGYGIKFLERQLYDKCQEIISFDDPNQKASVGDLLFCFDGPH